MSIVTREEYKTYNKIKNKLATSEKGTQTRKTKSQPTIIISTSIPLKRKRNKGDDDSYDNSSDDYDDSGYDSGYESGYESRASSESDKSLQTDNKRAEKKQKFKCLKQKLFSKNKQFYGTEDVDFYSMLDEEQQENIDIMESKISEINNVQTPIRFKILTSNMDIKLKSLAITKVDQLSMMEPSSSEYFKLYNYIENMSKIPIGKYKQLPISDKNDIGEISSFLDTTKTKLDEIVYGHKDAKDQIIRLLAKWISNPTSKGLVIGIEGVHGIGKTSLIKDGICEALGLPFGFVPLGGISDGSYMVGHSYTYEGSRWGRIADILMKVGCMNPVLYFDELDKISSTTYGQEIANLLIHLTDSTQNECFQDKYFGDINIDLSRCLIIFSYNHEDMINPILKDRMTIIKAKGYSVIEKTVIARQYMLPRILKEFAFIESDILLVDDVLSYIISKTDEEEGVRNLKRSLEEIVSQLNLHRLLKKPPCVNEDGMVVLPIQLTTKVVDMFLKKSKTDSNISHSMMYV